MSKPANTVKDRGRLSHYRMALITLILLMGSLFLTTRYYKGIESPELFPSNILVITLLNINFILVIALVLLLSKNLLKAYFERRLKLLGSGFRTKLIAAFVGLSLVPSILLFVVASGLLTSSIENWFSIQVEESLESSLEIAQKSHQDVEEHTIHTARVLGQEIAGNGSLQDPVGLREFLNKKLHEFQVSGIEIYSTPDQELIRVTAPKFKDIPFIGPTSEVLRESSEGREMTVELPIRRLGDRGKLIRGIVPMPGTGHSTGLIVVNQYLSGDILMKMDNITRAFGEYKQLKTFKNPIKGSYILSILIVTLLIIFSATWFGFYIAKGITVPIQKLAEGTHALAQGNLNYKIDVKAKDEIGILVDSFNKMTEDLNSSKTKIEITNQSLQFSNAELEQRRAYIETVFNHITTGVISLGPDGEITTVNRAAENVLNIPATDLRKKHYRDTFTQNNLDPLIGLVDQLKHQKKSSLEQDLELAVKGKSRQLRLYLTRLEEKDGISPGSIIVFDDLTELIKAQKAAAWQEVAQRIAHEIKNPLTPIQLSAQRLRKKYAENTDDFHQIFDDSTKIIIREVNSLKTLVNEFSNFARMPAPRPLPTDLHEVIQEVSSLYEGVHKHIRFIRRFDQDMPKLQLDRDQIKRVFVNLFENAVEAARMRGDIRLSTRFDTRVQQAHIEVTDEGTGILPEDHNMLFTPYFSRKKNGTGLGLAIVHRIISDHNGHIQAVQNEPKGTRILIDLPA